MRIDTLLQSLRDLKLIGMAGALEIQRGSPEVEQMSFQERLTLLLDQEKTNRSSRRLKSRLRVAKLKEPQAMIEDLHFAPSRGLDKSQVLSFSSCDWMVQKRNIVISGSTGTGKTYLSCALAQRACRDGYTCRFFRVSKLMHDIAVSRADGSYGKFMTSLAKTDLLILDDWGLSPFTEEERRDFLEIIDDRHKSHSMIITSQIPIENWFDQIGDGTIADAIMDRIVSTSYRLQLKGPSLRPENR